MWHFPKLGPQEPREESKLDNFFDEQIPAVALTRESLQNSRDAGRSSETPIKVAFSFQDISLDVLKRYLRTENGSLLDHVAATGPTFDSPVVRSLLIEDFNTKGLDGPTDHMQFGSEGNFIAFWWEQGLSSKQKGSGGSHGVGKTKLSTSSEIKCFFALTKRADDEKTFLIGFCLLPYHVIDQQQFRGYARYGNVDQNDHLHPLDEEVASDSGIIDEFKEDFVLTRADEPGLSIVVPAISQEITPDSIEEAVLSEFFMPVIDGKIIVEINDRENKKEKSLRIDREYIENWYANFDPKDGTLEQQQQHALIGVALNLDQIGLFYADPKSGIGKDHNVKIDSNAFVAGDLEKMQNAFDRGEVVGVQFQVLIEPNHNNPGATHSVLAPLKLYLQQKDGKNLRASAFLRGAIKVRNERPNIAQPYSVAILDARNEDLSEYLKWAEDPGHQKWQYKRLKDTKRYRSDTALRIVLKSLKETCALLSGVEDEKQMKGVASDIFSIVENKSSRKNGENPPRPPEPPAPSATPFVLHRIAGGFRLSPGKDLAELQNNGELELPFRITTSVGYKVFLGNSVKKYNALDFDLSSPNFTISAEGAEVLNRKHNHLEVEIVSDEFDVVVSGFDPERDIEVRAVLSAGVNE